MAQVSGIQIRISGDSSNFQQSVSSAEKSINSFNTVSQGVFSRITGALNGLGKGFANTFSRINVSLLQFTGQLQQADAHVQAFRNQTERASNVIAGNFGSKVQQASYQIQDFAVQVASGTSATRAFSQQAPQLLSGFGVVGTVLGTILAIGVPLGAMLIDTGKAASGLGSALSTVGPYAAVATAALAGFYAPSILAGLASTTSAIGVGLVGAIRSVTAAMLANPLGLLVAGLAAAAVALFAFRDDLKQIFGVDFVGVIAQSVNWTIDKFVKLAKTIGAVWGNLGNIIGNAIVGAANIALRAMTAMVNGGIAGINTLINAVNSLSDYTGITLGQFEKLSAAQFENPFAKGAAAAGSEIGKIWADNQVTDYVGEMGKLASGAMSKVAALFSGMGGADAGAGKGKGKGKTAENANAMAPSQEPGNYWADRLKAIQDHFKTEMELKQQQYELDQQALDLALSNKQLSEQNYYTLSQKLAQEHEDAMTAIRSQGIQNNLGAASSFFGSMASIAQSGGKRFLKVQKAMAAAQAIVDTIRAAVSAMNDPTAITLPQKIANYAAVMAQGMSAVAAIRGVSEGGGGGGGGGGKGGGGGGGGGRSGGNGGASGQTTTFAFTLTNDPMGFGEKFARQFIDQLNATQRNGGTIRGVIA